MGNAPSQEQDQVQANGGATPQVFAPFCLKSVQCVAA